MKMNNQKKTQTLHPKFLATSTGTLLTKPPSINKESEVLTGGRNGGKEIVDRKANQTGPDL